MGDLVYTNQCFRCGSVFDPHALHRRFSRLRCAPCQRAEWRAVERAKGARQAMKEVYKAILAGQLAHPSAFACADCADAARVYDHRDYGEPLRVEPVCLRCNVRRGPAVPVRRAA